MKNNEQIYQLKYLIDKINTNLLPKSIRISVETLKSDIERELNIFGKKEKEKLCLLDKRNFFIFIIKSLYPYFDEYRINLPFNPQISMRVIKKEPAKYKSEEDYLYDTLVYGKLSSSTLCTKSSVEKLSYIINKPTKLTLDPKDDKYFNMEYIPLCKGCTYYRREEHINTEEDFEDGYIKNNWEIGKKRIFHHCDRGKYSSYGYQNMDECIRKESDEYKKLYDAHIMEWKRNRKIFIKNTQSYRILAMRLLKRFDDFVYNYIDKDTFFAVLYLINRNRTCYPDRLTKEMEKLTLASIAKYYIDFDNQFIRKWI